MVNTYNPTWFERSTMPDLITRGLNVGSGAPTQAPNAQGEVPYHPAPVTPWMTQPGMRPTVTQRFIGPFLAQANTPAVPISNSRLEVTGIVFNIYSTAGASAWWGTAGVTTTTGIEIRPGIPGVLSLDQVREQWELQRQLEHIAALVTTIVGGDQMGPYKAPRVIIDLSQIYLASVALQNVTVLGFLPPEFQ